MAAWTPEALAAVSKLTGPEDWSRFHQQFPLISYDAWETKRRRVNRVRPADEEAADEAAAQAVVHEMLTPRVNIMPSIIPHLGPSRGSPDFVGVNTAFFDIEATDLKANFGRLLCMSVADSFGNVTTFRADDPQYEGKTRRDDSLLAIAIRDHLETFDHWVGWNSKRYDIPFINTRLVMHDLRPLRSDIMHTDPMYTSRHALRLHSSRLDAVAKTFRLDDQKTPLDPGIWEAAMDGDREAMDYVVVHCEADVLVLRGAYQVLKPFIRIIHR